jgi:hypothetical protein
VRDELIEDVVNIKKRLDGGQAVKDKDRLVGWDDEKVYLYLEGQEHCISDEPELVEKIIALCREYYEQKARQEGAEDER